MPADSGGTEGDDGSAEAGDGAAGNFIELPDDFDISRLSKRSLEKLLNAQYKARINGKDEARSLKDLIRDSQKGLSADEKMREAAQVRKAFDEVISMSKTNPDEYFKSLGFTDEQIDEMAKMRLARKIKWETMNEDERAAYLERQELEKFRTKEAADKAAAEAKVLADARDERKEYWDKEIGKAMQEAGLKSQFALKRMATYLVQAKKMGYKHVMPADVVDLVKRDQAMERADHYGSASIEDILSEMGKEKTEAIRQFFIKQVENPIKPGFTKAPAGKTPGKAQEKGPERMTVEQWRAWVDKRVNA